MQEEHMQLVVVIANSWDVAFQRALKKLLKKPSAALTSTKKKKAELFTLTISSVSAYSFWEQLQNLFWKAKKKYKKNGHLIHQQEDSLIPPVLSWLHLLFSLSTQGTVLNK